MVGEVDGDLGLLGGVLVGSGEGDGVEVPWSRVRQQEVELQGQIIAGDLSVGDVSPDIADEEHVLRREVDRVFTQL